MRESYRKRFLQDPTPIRLGGIAANLARIKSFSDDDRHAELVLHMIQDTEFLIEYASPEVELQTQAELVEIQLDLAIWQLKWQTLWTNPDKRRQVAEQAGRWSDRLLDLSGLANEA